MAIRVKGGPHRGQEPWPAREWPLPSSGLHPSPFLQRQEMALGVSISTDQKALYMKIKKEVTKCEADLPSISGTLVTLESPERFTWFVI